MQMTHADLSSMCTVDGCHKVGKFWLETDDYHVVSLLCGEHANDLVGVTLPDTPRYVAVQEPSTGSYSVLDAYMNKPVTIDVTLTDTMQVNSFSREVAEKLIEAIQLIEIVDS
jgi:hypothetical protein